MDRRCLIVSYYFPPTGGGGVQRILKLIKYGSRRDWQFTVIAAIEKGRHLEVDSTLSSDIPKNVKIIYKPANLPGESLGATPAKMKSTYWKRWLSAFLFIPDIRKRWLPAARKAVFQALDQAPYDCVLLSSPPFSLAILAAELSERLSLPVILDMRDHWTSYPFKIHPTPYHLYRDRQLERRAIRRIRYGISAYQSLLDYFQKNIPGFDSSRWTLIPNGYDEEDFIALPEKTLEKGFFNLAFFGTFYSHINPPQLLFKAIAMLKEQAPQAAARLRFYHIGFSHVDLKALAAKYGVSGQLVQLGYLPHTEALGVLQNMDAFCLILDDREPKSNNTIGGKVYEYLRLKKPILALVPEKGEAARLIRYTDSGEVLSPSNTNAIAAVLKEWQEKVPQLAFKNIEEFSRQYQAELFLKFFEKVIQEKTP